MRAPFGRFAFGAVLVLGAVAPLAATCPSAGPSHDAALSYRVRPLPGRGFDVELSARGLGRRPPTFRLLNGWGLLQDQPSRIESVVAEDAEGREIALERVTWEDETGWRPERSSSELRLRYRVRSVDPLVSPEASFTGQDEFLLLGYSVFLLPREVGMRDPVRLRVRVEAPAAWPVWASWPREGASFVPASPHDLWSGVAAGGGYRASRVQSGPVSVEVLTLGIPDLWGTTLANRLFPVLREMVALFGAPPRGDSLRVLSVVRAAPGPKHRGTVTGNSEEGAFLCLAAPDRLRDANALTLVAVHECLHFYLGGAVTASSEPPYRNAPDLIWLMEGVTEYLTLRLLENSNVFTPEAVEQAAVEKERSMRVAESKERLSLAESARRMGETRTYERVYARGFLVAERLHREMDAIGGPGTFDRTLRELFEEHNYYRRGVLLTPDRVRDVFEAHAPGIDRTIALYAEGDAPLPPRGGDLASGAGTERGRDGGTPPGRDKRRRGAPLERRR